MLWFHEAKRESWKTFLKKCESSVIFYSPVLTFYVYYKKHPNEHDKTHTHTHEKKKGKEIGIPIRGFLGGWNLQL